MRDDLELDRCIRCRSRVKSSVGTVCRTCLRSKVKEKRIERASRTLGLALATVRMMDATNKLRRALERADRLRRAKYPKRRK